MAISDVDRLRGLLSEVIPPGGSATETLFSDEQIQDFLDMADNDLDRAAYEGWRRKAAEFANLVNVTEGNSARDMSDLHKNALEMIAHYSRARAGPTEGRTRIGRIVRTELL